MSAETNSLSRFAWRTEGSASLYVAASPELVYDRVADVTRVGECSLEARAAQWVRGSSPGSVGARFRGRNRKGLIRWSRTCEVVEADRGRRFVFRTVPCRIDVSRRDSTVWAFTMQPEGTGTMLTHDYRIVRDAVPGLKQLYALLMPHHRDMRPHLEHTLRTVKDELEQYASAG